MLTFPTGRPQALLNAFRAAISSDEITTWEADGGGGFSHLANQWTYRASMIPTVTAGASLTFAIIFADDEVEKRLVYSYYHGHLMETFLNRLHEGFGPEAFATAEPTGDDEAF